LKISTDFIKELRKQSGAGIMECRNILIETEGDMAKALEFLKERSLFKAEEKKNRSALQGLVEAYIHTRGRIGAMVEVNCETDFAAQTDEFKELAHNLVLQVAAQNPQFISPEEAPEGAEIAAETDCLLCQPYIKNPDMTVQDIINEVIAKVGENIKVSQIARFALGE